MHRGGLRRPGPAAGDRQRPGGSARRRLPRPGRVPPPTFSRDRPRPPHVARRGSGDRPPARGGKREPGRRDRRRCARHAAAGHCERDRRASPDRRRRPGRERGRADSPLPHQQRHRRARRAPRPHPACDGRRLPQRLHPHGARQPGRHDRAQPHPRRRVGRHLAQPDGQGAGPPQPNPRLHGRGHHHRAPGIEPDRGKRAAPKPHARHLSLGFRTQPHRPEPLRAQRPLRRLPHLRGRAARATGALLARQHEPREPLRAERLRAEPRGVHGGRQPRRRLPREGLRAQPLPRRPLLAQPTGGTRRDARGGMSRAPARRSRSAATPATEGDRRARPRWA